MGAHRSASSQAPSAPSAPQSRWASFTFAASQTVVSPIAFGLRFGRRDRSCSPVEPSAKNRSLHLLPVLREMPNSRHKRATQGPELGVRLQGTQPKPRPLAHDIGLRRRCKKAKWRCNAGKILQRNPEFAWQKGSQRLNFRQVFSEISRGRLPVRAKCNPLQGIC